MGYLLLILFVLEIIGIYVLTNYYFNQVVTRKADTEEEMMRVQIERNLVNNEFYTSLEKEHIILTSKDGLKLRGEFIDNNSNKTMIFCHGITVGLIWSIKYIDMFYKTGWNILIYDHRRHGQSEGNYSTYGYFEKEDLDLWVNWVVKKKGKDSIIGLHGESMGAATVLQYIDINKYVKFIIADCPFSDLMELLGRKVKDDYKGLLYPILYLSNLKSKVIANFDYRWIKPIECVKNSTLPIMFIHGDEDKFVPWDMSVAMYEMKKKGLKKIYIAKGAAHAKSIEVNKKQYEKEVIDFVEEALKSYEK